MPNNGNGNGNNGWRTQPMYTYKEVARLSGVSSSTVRNWLHGYTNEYGKVEPIFKDHPDDEKVCSFLELAEIIVATRFRKAEHVKLFRVRNAYNNAKEIFNLEYPFASVELKGIGGHIVHIIHDPGISLQAIDEPEQFTLPGLVQKTLEQFEYKNKLASKWYPRGKDFPIVIDPQISAGLPIIKGRGITVDAIYKRFKADQDMAYIAKDYAIKRDVVEKVVQYCVKSREPVAI